MLEKKLIEAGPLERKREQVLKSIDKRAFLDVLMGGSKSIPVANEISETKTEEKSDGKVIILISIRHKKYIEIFDSLFKMFIRFGAYYTMIL